MIPIRLRLHNFMCYRGDATLDLEGIHLACLAGENGHGKSALLDALTYALWGEARAKHDDELITLRTNEMEVELEFLLGTERYRVLRKRARKGKSHIGTLDLQSWNGERFTPITGSSTKETQARITQILRMNYDTFINSAFLVQGRADEFARKGPADRKQVLADILGLQQYDVYEDRAKQRVRALDEEAVRLNADITALQQELRQRPEHEAKLQRLEAEAAEARNELESAETELQALRDEKRGLEAQAAQAAEVETRLAAARRDLEQTAAQAEAQRRAVDTLAERLADGARIAEDFAALQRARAQDSALNNLLSQSAKLSEERNRFAQEVQTARAQLEFEARTLRERLAALDDQIADAAAKQPEYERFRAQLEELTEKEVRREALRERQAELHTTVADLTAANKHLRAHMDVLKERMNLLEGVALCPVCRQPLPGGEAERLRAEYLTEGKEARERYDAAARQITEHGYESEQNKKELIRLEQDLRAKPATQTHEARLAELLQRADAALPEREAAAARRGDVEARLARGAFAEEAQAQLAQTEERLRALGYSAAAHEEVRRLVATLSPHEAEHAQLQAARERLDAERQTLRLLDQNVSSGRLLIAAQETALEALAGARAKLEPVSRAVAERQKQVNDLQGRHANLNRQVGAARQLVEHAKQSEVTLAERQSALKTLHAERALNEELRIAFGKKGVQAMLIETAIPEIEQEANRLLGQMTDGRMRVAFETQREKLAAKRDEANAIETLDIVISDDQGARGYEMYSGGESFRVNFAVRIALSKLLARRAGARLQTLVIDEGFGVLDTTGRERMVEAITAVQDQFEKILVVTHLDELKDMFPVRIDVVKTGGGSSIFIN